MKVENVEEIKKLKHGQGDDTKVEEKDMKMRNQHTLRKEGEKRGRREGRRKGGKEGRKEGRKERRKERGNYKRKDGGKKMTKSQTEEWKDETMVKSGEGRIEQKKSSTDRCMDRQVSILKKIN